MMNRSIKYGRYALIFNSQLELAAKTKDIGFLTNIINESNFPELNNLPVNIKTDWSNGINTQILTMNLYTDRIRVIQKNSDYNKCLEIYATNNLEIMPIIFNHI